MNLTNFSFKRFLFKLFILFAIFYSFVLFTSLMITGYLFFSLNNYKVRIQNVVYRHTGYKLNVDDIHSSLTSTLAPEIVIYNARAYNPTIPTQTFKIKQIDLIFSYSSIWNLEPIFDKIILNGTDINFEYLKNSSITINGINLNHPDKKTIENTKNSPIDLENWILKQQTIELKKINLSFLDSKNNLPKIQLFNVAASLNKLKHENHVFNLDIGKSKSDANKILSLFLSWKGGKVSQFQQWKEANLKVTSYNNNDTLANTMQKYIPNIAIIDKFNADTAIDAKLSNGKLQYFYANFDIKNLHYMFKNKSNFINFPQLGGSIDIKLHENNQYSILAKNLNLSTPYGYLFNNKNVTGNYVVGKNGQISIKDTDIQSFNNLISLLPKFNNFSLNGTLNIIKLSWIGKITRPSDFNIILNFKNFEIISKESNIPSFNNINGEININKESGAANFDLINSTLKYPKVFLIPYIFKKMHTNIRWQFHQDKSFDVFLDKTNIQTQDFNATLHGKYTYVPDTNGFLNLSAHLDKILISKVGDYLPKVIGVSVHKWLNNALIGGHAANGVLTLKGWIANFPFSDGNGMFYIDADVQNGKLRYVNDWPTLDNINGKFKIRNQKIIITTNDAYVNSNKITNAIVTIPNMIDPYRVYLTADGNAQGSTSNFLNYLANTPINHLIGNIPEKVSATGNGNVAIHLVIPFNNPKTSQVKGSYTFINNSLLFKLPIPQLDAVNGDLFFSEKGFSIDKISTTVLNNLAQINASDKNKQIIFNVLFPNLNSQDILNYYLPFFTPIFSGKTTANLSFDITSNGLNQLNVGSNLIGVKINAPYPLHKDESESKKLTLQLIPNNSDKFTKININYDNFLHALLNLQEHGKLAHANIIVGANNQQNLFTPNSPKILIDLNSDKLSGNEWLGTIVSLLENNKNNKSLVLESKASGQPQIKPHNESNGDIFPIEILSNVEQFSVYKTNYYHLDSDILVLKDKTIFNFNNTFTNGFGTYTNQNKDLNIVLNEFNAQTTVNEAKEKIAKHHNFPSYSSTDSDFTNLNSLAAINTNLGPHFNESNYKIILNNYLIKHNNESTVAYEKKLPNINISIQNLFYENIKLATAKVILINSGNNLIIESGNIIGNTTNTTFSGVNYCIECGPDKAFVNLDINMQLNDIGKMVTNLGYPNLVAGGTGKLNANLQWNGKIQNFSLANTIGSINANFKDGKLLKVRTGNFLGEIIGLINLQTITSLAHLDFTHAVSNGFYFYLLKFNAYIFNNVLNIKSLYMSGPLANVYLYGTININNEAIDAYMSIVPKVSAGIAVGAAAATLNPLVGIAVYIAEWVLDQPFNKLLSFSYHLTGNLKHVNLTKVNISQQIINNINSTLTLDGK